MKKALATNFAGRRIGRVTHCEHCKDRRLVWSELLRKSIPCPQCRRKPRQDSSGLKLITAVEKRRMNRLVQRAVQIEIAAAMGLGDRIRRADPFYATTDRIMQRWAAGNGSGLPKTDEDWEAAATKALDADVFSPEPSRPPTLDDATHVEVEHIVQRSPQAIQMFVRQWYCSDVPCLVIAKQRGIRHEDVYVEWRAVLGHLKLQFETSGHRDLISLVNGQV